MSRTDFITLEDALRVHSRQLRLFGGRAGVRDAGLLVSALGMAQASFDGEYLHPTLVEKAAAYLFHVAQNHPFVDGNKRTALGIALLFLALNGLEVEAPDDDLAALVLRVASGAASKAEVAVFLGRHAR